MNELMYTLCQQAKRVLTCLSLECFVSTGELSQHLELIWCEEVLFLPGRKWVLHLTVVSFRSDNSQVFQAGVLRTRRNSTTVMNRHSLVRKPLHQPQQVPSRSVQTGMNKVRLQSVKLAPHCFQKQGSEL